jgi:tRNA threonylcarbamoyladenosine biosynthesis protein TsaE
MVINSQSAQDTREFAASLAEQFKSEGGTLALIGDLGSGKTTFTQGFAEALGIKEKIASPTFTLIKQHQIPRTERTLYHLDLYRLEEVNPDELGLTDLFQQKEDIVLIEWAEKLEDKLPKEALVIKFKHLEENQRQIELIEK